MTTRFQSVLAAAIVVAIFAVGWAATTANADASAEAGAPIASGFLTIESPNGALTFFARFY